MANPTLSVLQTKALTITYFDGAPDVNGNATGNPVVNSSTIVWSAVPAANVNIVSTGKNTANVTGVTARTGVVITAKEPIRGFIKTLTIDVLAVELLIKSATIVLV